ncbi:MutS-related protein [Arachidicoccus terrestris]|uniref:MutS-related protein n=1 Tax=Arachidicoccus terrestris TaxID=2875539 RepID=UPI001CC5ADF2|nr:DNA mismatch repair protein [Arachidicoccus terrestris]UAY55739.1 DNA mismatch repair protein [Arachidicoccus terrestris]
MKYLQTDEQTLNDLGLFGKPGQDSIYDLYNHTVTQGGGARLREIFKQPLSDAREIQHRVHLYTFFSQKDYRFPVDSTTTGTVAYYLENTDVRSQLQVEGQSLRQKMKNMIAADSEYVFVEDGVQAALRMFYQLDKFLREICTQVERSAFEGSYKSLRTLLDEHCFEQVRSHMTDKSEARINDLVLSELDKALRFSQREKLLELLEGLYELDVCIAIGRTARKNDFHFAVVSEDNAHSVALEKIFHPHVKNAIANNLLMDASHNVLFLTGANMAGKSTLMKSIGIALYLAHMGFPVAALNMHFSVMDGIYTSINLADNLSAGASHYYAEVLRVKEVAGQLQAGKRLFVIFDELFRGTNVKDAYDATIAVTKAFSRKKNSLFIISTHIMEAGEKLKEEKLGILYQYLPTEMQGNTPVYTRVLREGITADRQGMVIIENEGILEMLDKGLQ